MQEVMTYTAKDIPSNLMAIDALRAQGACNGTALAISLAEHIKELRASFPSKSTDWYNQHPVVYLIVHQLLHLSGPDLSPTDSDKWEESVKLCEEVSGEKL